MARTDALAGEGLDAALDRCASLRRSRRGHDLRRGRHRASHSIRRFREAAGVPILANITEFGHTPLFTRDQLRSAEVDIVLYCCGAYRAMNAAALAVYRPSAAKARRASAVPTSCKPAPSSTTSSAITPTNTNSTNSSPQRTLRSPRRPRSRSLNDRNPPQTAPAHRVQAQEIRRALRHPRRQHRPVHRRPQRQRPPLSRL